MEKLTLHISGMHCAGCELKVEKAVLALDGVESAKASLSRSSLSLSYDAEKTTAEQIIRAINDAGYAADIAPAEAKKGSVLKLIGILVILFGIYMLISHTVGFNFIPEVAPGAGLGVVFLIGLMTSLHCLAMCGGINLSQNVNTDTAGIRSKLLPGLKYNAGRVLSYTLIGGIVGAIGSVISFSGTAKGVVMFVAGILMILVGLNMLGLPFISRLKLHMPKSLARKAGNISKGRPFVVGLLNGLMPCGPLQAMQLHALGTGSFVMGALSMMVFALGTVPLMFLFGALSAFLNSRFTRIIGKLSALLIIIIGFAMFGRGFGFTGIAITPAGSPSTQTTATVVDNTQVIRTTFSSGSYAPITVKQGIPVVWTIHISEKDINGCNNPLIIPEYGIEKKLVPGDNIIEFYPEESGVFTYSCWMGMIRSTVTVVESDDVAPTQTTQQHISESSNAILGSCCTSS